MSEGRKKLKATVDQLHAELGSMENVDEEIRQMREAAEERERLLAREPAPLRRDHVVAALLPVRQALPQALLLRRRKVVQRAGPRVVGGLKALRRA
mgnify:CR=1 FL=1